MAAPWIPRRKKSPPTSDMLSLVLTATSFHAPMGSVVAPQRAAAPSMIGYKGGFWNKPEFIEKQEAARAAREAATPAPVAAAAATGSMGVAEACTFMADPSVAGVSFEAKKAFLAGKGVSEFVIAEAACTAPDTTLVL